MKSEPITVEFTGVENLDQIFEKLPQKYAKKPVIAAMKKGASIFTKDLRLNTPKKSGVTRRAIGVKAGKGTTITVGFRTGGSYMPAWFKAYWSNYGTLENRDSSHSFVKGRLPKSRSWNGGIRPLRFVEASWNRTQGRVEKTIMDNLKSETDKLLDKYTVK